MAADTKRVLLIIAGGIAAYKSLDLIRRLKERGIAVRCILTKAAEQFVTPLSASALVGERIFTDLFDLAGEFDVGHIRLARETDLIVVAPATADLMAKMAGGHADDLATAVLLATTAKIVLAPAMNSRMWANKSTQRNLAQLVADGVALVGPNEGEMAEADERGLGRMAEPLEIAAAVEKLLNVEETRLLQGQRVLVTSGPTHEPIDPVRYIANRSSGKQGHAIAAAAAAAGADVTLVSGPVNVPDPPGVKVIKVETAREMLEAVERALPADIAIFAAAVADWRVANAGEQKIKKKAGQADAGIVAGRKSRHPRDHRTPQIPAAETGDRFCRRNRERRRQRQGKACQQRLRLDSGQRCLAATGIMGGDRNTISWCTRRASKPGRRKARRGERLVARIADR